MSTHNPSASGTDMQHTPENVKCQTCGGTGSLGGNFGPTAWQRCPDCTPENVECPCPWEPEDFIYSENVESP